MFFITKLFKIKEKDEVNREIWKYDFFRYSPSGISTINTPNSQIYINIPRADSVNSWVNSYFDSIIDVLPSATNNRYVDGKIIRLVNVGTVALFSTYKLLSSSGKQIEEINHAHKVCLMYKLITSSKNGDDLSIGFDRNRERRRSELTNNKK